MDTTLYLQLTIPLLGTTLGAACVFFMKHTFSEAWQRGLIGFAAGVMTAASFWSLLQPAIEQSKGAGIASAIPALVGFGSALLSYYYSTKSFLTSIREAAHQKGLRHSGKNDTAPLGCDDAQYSRGNGCRRRICRIHDKYRSHYGYRRPGPGHRHCHPEHPRRCYHLYAPSRTESVKSKSFLMGLLSGIVEPIGAIITILFAETVVPLLPYLLSFAAGAMLYVVVEELIPEMSAGNHSHVGVITYSVGFTLMMLLDVSL